MARGWESKDVESQLEDAATQRNHTALRQLTGDELLREREVDSLEMSRIRIRRDLEAAQHPRHRNMLEAALQHLEQRLTALSAPSEDQRS